MKVLKEMVNFCDTLVDQLQMMQDENWKFDRECIIGLIENKIDSCNFRIELERKIIEEAINE